MTTLPDAPITLTVNGHSRELTAAPAARPLSVWRVLGWVWCVVKWVAR